MLPESNRRRTKLEMAEAQAPGVWITLDQARLLRDMCQNATAPDGKTKILLGETQLALEEQLQQLQPAPSRQVRRAAERKTGARGHSNGSAQPAATAAAASRPE